MTQVEALVLSLAIEVPIGVGLARRGGAVAGWRLVAVVTAATLLTHPFAWWGVQWAKPRVGFAGGAAVVEAAVVAAEALWFTRSGLARPWRLAFVANAASFGFGLVLRYLSRR